MCLTTDHHARAAAAVAMMLNDLPLMRLNETKILN